MVRKSLSSLVLNAVLQEQKITYLVSVSVVKPHYKR